MNAPARVKEIYLGPERAAPMLAVATVQAVLGQGLEGDRYALGLGSFSNSKGIRDVTLIETEALWELAEKTGIELHPALTRRNFITEGVRLADLIGVPFSIGSVSLLGLRPCPPCHHLAKLVGIPEILPGLAYTGGIYAQILTGGLISVNDPIVASAATLPAAGSQPA